MKDSVNFKRVEEIKIYNRVVRVVRFALPNIKNKNLIIKFFDRNFWKIILASFLPPMASKERK